MMNNTELAESKKKKILILCGVLGALTVISLMLVFVLNVMLLQEATDGYNLAVKEYNSNADEYNSLAQMTAVENLQGFYTSVEKLELVSTDISAIIASFLRGNSARKTEDDIRTIQNESDYLLDDIGILKQITAPSELWVMNRLENVDDIFPFRR